MSSAIKNLSAYDASTIPDAQEFRFGIVVSEWHAEITHALYEGCAQTLSTHGAQTDNIEILQVPGTFELTAGARLLAGRHTLDAIICIGCVIQGETKHNEYINNAVATGLTSLSLATGVPCIYGVLTPNTETQAKDRAGGKYGNKGVEAAVTAIRMAAAKRGLGKTKNRIGFSQK